MYKIIGADKKEYGPVMASQVQQWLSEGRINGQTLLRVEPGGDWRPLNSYPEFGAPPLVVPPLAKPPPNYLVYSVLCTVCACTPFGIVALVYSIRVGSRFTAGDVAGAERASKLAKVWCWVAFIVGMALNIASFFFLDLLKQLSGLSALGLGN